MAVHGDQERSETPDPELPDRFGMEVVEVDVLDRLDPGRFQRRGAADDRQIGAAGSLEHLERPGAEPALADDEPHPQAFQEGLREALHASRGGGADAQWRVTRGMRRGDRPLPHIGGGVDRGMAAQVESGLAAPVEECDQVRVANAEKRSLEGHRVVHAQRADLALGNRRREDVVGHQNPYSTPAGVNAAEARRAEWHCMFTATGFIVMCVAAISTCTANAVESPPRPWGPTPSMFTASARLASSAAPSGSAQAVPRARVAAFLASATQRSEVPPMPTPTMVGGQVLPPASSTQSTTKVLIAFTPSAGIAIFSQELFSDPLPFGTISITRRSRSSEKSRRIAGTPGPHDVCSFLRVIGCTIEERSGCSRVARSQPRRIARLSSTPSTSTPRPMVTL